MKSLLLSGLFLCCLTSLQAQSNDKFIKSMTTNVAMLDTSTRKETLQILANNFSRIAGKETTEWLPNYYLAYCDIMLSYMNGADQIDTYCDQADSALSKADKISPNNSEITTLKAWSCSARIMVNPMSRGAKFGGMASGLESQAMNQDPSNPRPYLLRGQGLYYTPAAFGGGKDKALPVLQQAVTKFGTFKPKNVYDPHWGAEQAKKMLDQCK